MAVTRVDLFAPMAYQVMSRRTYKVNMINNWCAVPPMFLPAANLCRTLLWPDNSKKYLKDLINFQTQTPRWSNLALLHYQQSFSFLVIIHLGRLESIFLRRSLFTVRLFRIPKYYSFMKYSSNVSETRYFSENIST